MPIKLHEYKQEASSKTKISDEEWQIIDGIFFSIIIEALKVHFTPETLTVSVSKSHPTLYNAGYANDI